MSEGDPILKMGGDALKWAWNNPEEVWKRISRVKEWFGSRRSKGASSDTDEADTHVRPGILIIGPGGVGKTTIARILSGDFDRVLTDASRDYQESLNVEEFSLKDDPKIGIVVPPGQEHRRPSTWKELLSEIASGKYRGIILLNAYGYHTFGIGYRDHRIYLEIASPRNRQKFMSAYLENRRLDELSVAQKLAPYVQQCQGKLWVLTVVAKQDLWWTVRDQVSQYYSHGPYQSEMVAMFAQHDPLSRRHETAMTSLVISNFRDGEGEILQANNAGYDHREQVDSLRRLFEIMFDLMKWEQG